MNVGDETTAAQGVLFELGEPMVPVEVALGTKKVRRSRARAWSLFMRMRSAESHVVLREVWTDVLRERARGVLDNAMRDALSDEWNRRSEKLRTARAAPPRVAPKISAGRAKR